MAPSRAQHSVCVLFFFASVSIGLELNPLRWVSQEKIKTAMLANNVPRGSTILELSAVADARTLSLYTEPRKVICCSTRLGEQSLLQAAAERNAVKLECIAWRGPASIAALSGACDVVVACSFFDSLDEGEGFDEALQLVQTALRPGGRLVWIEPDRDGRLGERVGAGWRVAFPAAELFQDGEEGLDLGVAIKPPEPRAGAGRPRGAPQRAGRGFGARS